MSRRIVASSAGRRLRNRPTVVLAAAITTVAALVACGRASGDQAGAVTSVRAESSSQTSAGSTSGKAPAISLGAGFLAFPDAARQWVAAHPDDRRTPSIARRIASQPTALWLTGNESFGNLAAAVNQARAAHRTMILSIYNIPLRYDGLSSPSTISLDAYETWVDRVATMIGTTRAVVVLEPDALWFYDRMASDADRAVRMTALNYAVDTLSEAAPRSRVYLDAGTSSKSVTPDRMADLLVAAGVSKAAGYAVNTSSYAPTASIQAYAQQIRAALRARGVANPRYVTDTGRNGASTWSYDWCNPPGQRLGRPPRLLRSADGRDMNLWIKAPGTSDGDCGPRGGGKGTYGGQFIPSLAFSMLGK